jgi:hypothetical protein
MTAPTPKAIRPIAAFVAGSKKRNVPENCRSPGPNAIQVAIAPKQQKIARPILQCAHPARRCGGEIAGRVGLAERLESDRNAGKKKCQARAGQQPKRTVQI